MVLTECLTVATSWSALLQLLVSENTVHYIGKSWYCCFIQGDGSLWLVDTITDNKAEMTPEAESGNHLQIPPLLATTVAFIALIDDHN